MTLAKRYDPAAREPELQARWAADGTYDFTPDGDRPVFSIDTPPPTVSGRLHLGHVYSYSHTDFIARYRRMRGENVFYPMGYDDNGLPTERLVEREIGRTSAEMERAAFVARCLAVSRAVEAEYEALWRRLALSIDWRYTYRTIEPPARRAAQASFLELLRRDLAYRREAPTLWCPECRTAIAQAELADLTRPTTFHSLAFALPDGARLPIATTRPELLPACVAVFVHPDDGRFRHLVGRTAGEPLFDREVPVLTDPAADPEKGTGAVMCCTFGDATDVAWWRAHDLPLVAALDRDGRLTAAAGEFEALATGEARARILDDLRRRGRLLAQWPAEQTVPAHERCDTPVEILVTAQWFVRVLAEKDALLRAGAAVRWHPEHMGERYREWVTNLAWDWCISRQRAFGVPFPLWTCRACGAVVTATEDRLPLDPATADPPGPCPCGSTDLEPERDVMDTWATSSLTPQIAGRWLEDPALYARVFPFSLRPQAHEIIRTWAFYTLTRAHHHFGCRPWSDVMISGWGLAPEGSGKISKSRGGGPVAPPALIERYSADAVRYWAAGTGPGKDALISEAKVGQGAKLVTKLWNVARLAEPFLRERRPGEEPTTPARSGHGAAQPAGSARPGRSGDGGSTPPGDERIGPPGDDRIAPPGDGAAIPLSPADRWILSRLQHVIAGATAELDGFDYAAARSLVEAFFWRDLADNYLEMAKGRLYEPAHPEHTGACFALRRVLLGVTKLLAPVLPHVTEAIYLELFAASDGAPSIHRSAWPTPDPTLVDAPAERVGEHLLAIATAVRRFKSEAGLSLAAPLARLRLVCGHAGLRDDLAAATADLMSVTRARRLAVSSTTDPRLVALGVAGPIGVWVGRDEATGGGIGQR